ncbi:MAG: hypothetical protein WC496_09075 [Phycisphaerae bacterium]|jgi:hypothetical protein
MKKMLNVVLMVCFSMFLQGCKESADKSSEINRLISQMKPLQVYNDGNEIMTITVNQAMAFHENHEHSQSNAESSHISQNSHICMGVLIGYKAIGYAAQQLFGDEIPKAADFDIKVSGSMDGVWDVMSLYTGRELKFEDEETELNLQSYTFTAKRIPSDKSVTFCVRGGLIPDGFFAVKNQGATCSNAELRKVKQQALLNILSAEHQNCFDFVESASGFGR